jgi:hypothetical protein
VSDEPRLTFAIPFYRNIDYLRRAIDSVLTQSVDNWRLLVCDDAGPDPEAGDVVRAYDDERIVYTRNVENLGIGGNWNRCVSLASAEFVTLLHADDELLPVYAATVVRAHDEYPNSVAVYPRATVIDSAGRRMFSAPDLAKRVIEPRSERVVLSGRRARRLMCGQTVFCPALCYRRALLGGEPFSARWGWCSTSRSSPSSCSETSNSWACARSVRISAHTASQSAELTAEHAAVPRARVVRRDADQAEARGWARAARTARDKRIVRLHLAYRAAVDVLHARGSAAREKMALMRDK